MSSELSCLRKVLSTLFTAKGSFPHVGANVIIKCRGSRKRSRAESTLEWLLTGMRVHVTSKFSRGGERQLALPASKGLDWLVRTHVYLQHDALSECLLTLSTAPHANLVDTRTYPVILCDITVTAAVGSRFQQRRRLSRQTETGRL